jgi:transposase
LAAQIQAVEHDLPLELWAMDESRFGLQTIRRRRLTLPGVKPIGTYQFEFANFYTYGLVAPRTGEGYFEARLTMNAHDFEAFLHAFAAEEPDRFHLILLDNARSHHAKTLTLPANLALLFLPPYAPELNPCERVWLALKNRLACLCFPSLYALQESLATFVEAFDPLLFRSLIAFPFICNAIPPISP